LLKNQSYVCALLVLLLSGLWVGCSGNANSGNANNGTTTIAPDLTRPCDLFAAATPCVAAFSTTRTLYATYSGTLYQVTRASDGTTMDIGVLSDGYANAASQDTFCASTTCTITKLYDQSSNHNDLTLAPPGSANHGAGPNGYDLPAVADALPITAGGHKVYGISIIPGMGYRNDATKGIATGASPEGVYMLTSAPPTNGDCCFDFGNAEKNDHDNGISHMDAISMYRPGNSPHAGIDMENGIYGDLQVPPGTSFVTDMGANDGQQYFTVWQGNAKIRGLTTTGPTSLPSGYAPMHLEGSIILGIGGDNSNRASGYFFEGVMTQGAPTDAMMNNVQNNIVTASYTGL
jgi:hypothetical protein